MVIHAVYRSTRTFRYHNLPENSHSTSVNLEDPVLIGWVILPGIILVARVVETSLKTLRLVYVAKGLKNLAAVIGMGEVAVWLLSTGLVLTNLTNVLGIFAGTLIVADLFIESLVPAWLADWLIQRSKKTWVALLAICALAGIISAFVENVATVLIVAPIALALAQRLKISPVPVLIGIAISSNLQGTATLIGDPPSMITAGFLSHRWGLQGGTFGFNEFFFFRGKPSIFFAIQLGAIVSLVVLYWFFRKVRQRGKKGSTVHGP